MFAEAGRAQSAESKILTLNDVPFRLSLTLIFTRQMLNEEEWKIKGDFLCDFQCLLLSFVKT